MILPIAKATKIAEIMNGWDDWGYVVQPLDTIEDRAIIRVYDEEQNYLGEL